MKVTFLGTNGWYDTAIGNTICTLIDAQEGYIILDAGNGFYKLGEYINTPKPIYLFLSHFHLDHIIGLHVTNKFTFTQGIDVYGPPSVKRTLGKLLNTPFTAPLGKLKTKLRLYSLTKKIRLPFLLEFRRLRHASLCYGYRFALEGKIVSYCMDTGMCRNLFLLSQNADLLITECSYAPGEKNTHWPHLNPEEAAHLAKQAKAKKLFLTHFDAARYETLGKRKEAQRAARKYFASASVVLDDMRVVL